MSTSTVVGGYGAGRTSGRFEPLNYIKKSEVILRLFGWVFAIVVFGCIASKGWLYGRCVYTKVYYFGNSDPCNFGIAVGVISFLGLMAFLVTDAIFEMLSNIQYRKYIVIADVCFSCGWGFVWLVCFCYLSDSWRRYGNSYSHPNEAQAALAFAFFSLVIYISLAILAIIRLRQGVMRDPSSAMDASPPTYNETVTPPAAAASVYGGGDAQFSPQPFGTGSGGNTFSSTTDPPAY